jgi:hypothetical protein
LVEIFAVVVVLAPNIVFWLFFWEARAFVALFIMGKEDDSLLLYFG